MRDNTYYLLKCRNMTTNLICLNEKVKYFFKNFHKIILKNNELFNIAAYYSFLG
jgi:hypothetical protein